MKEITIEMPPWHFKISFLLQQVGKYQKGIQQYNAQCDFVGLYLRVFRFYHPCFHF